MAICKSCGKKGLFLKLFNGNCKECDDSIKKEKQRKINAAKSSAQTYYNSIVQLFTEICASLNFNANPIERLSQITLIDEKINICDRLLSIVNEYASYHYLNEIMLSKISYDDEWSKNHGNGKIKELSIRIWNADKNCLPSIMEELKSNINHQKHRWVHIKEQIIKYADFQNTLISIPNYEIVLSSDKISKKALADLNDIKFSSITAKSNYNRLGNFVVIDTETTGLSSTRDEIIEIAAIYFEDWEPCIKFETLIKPKHSIPDEITQINGITNEMVNDAPTIKEVIPSLLTFIGNKPIVGHNLFFDMKFLYKNGLDFLSEKHKYFDTLEIAQKILKKPKMKWDKEYECYDIDYDSDYDVEDHKLDTLCEHYQIRDSYSSHRAASDCLATGILFQTLVKEKTNS